MATKADLEAELAMLRSKMAESNAAEATDGPVETPETAEPDDTRAGGFADAKAELERLLAPHGVSVSDVEGLADQLWEELESLPQNKPLLTAIGAFALGFVLGRMTK